MILIEPSCMKTIEMMINDKLCPYKAWLPEDEVFYFNITVMGAAVRKLGMREVINKLCQFMRQKKCCLIGFYQDYGCDEIIFKLSSNYKIEINGTKNLLEEKGRMI